MTQLTTEEEVISLIGFETPLKFEFISDDIFTFRTVIPNQKNGIVYYDVEFFSNPDKSLDFFAYDTFSNFLLKYQIHSVTAIDKSENTETEIYFKTYE
jgi:hypothetical protein|tara:strand:- start:181 stop:474 length:294 start_codon:yes stop_codon:yes gene_type:complete